MLVFGVGLLQVVAMTPSGVRGLLDSNPARFFGISRSMIIVGVFARILCLVLGCVQLGGRKFIETTAEIFFILCI